MFTAKLPSLLSALAAVATAADSRSPNAAHSAVLFSPVGKDAVSVSVTGTAAKICVTIAAAVTGAGAFALSAKRLCLISDVLHADDVEFTLKGQIVVLKCGPSEFRIPVIPVQSVAELPKFPAPAPTAKTFSANAGVLAQALLAAEPCASTDRNRAILQTVCIDPIGNGTAAVVATDGKRLAMTEVEAITELSSSMALPLPLAKFISKHAKGGEGDIKITPTGGHFQIEIPAAAATGFSGPICATFAGIDGTYPDYRKVLRSKKGVGAMCGIDELAVVVDAAETMVPENKSLRLALAPGKVRFLAESATNGEFREDVAAEYEGPGLEMLLNVQFLSDAIKPCRHNKLSLRIAGNQAVVEYGTFTGVIVGMTEVDKKSA